MHAHARLQKRTGKDYGLCEFIQYPGEVRAAWLAIYRIDLSFSIGSEYPQQRQRKARQGKRDEQQRNARQDRAFFSLSLPTPLPLLLSSSPPPPPASARLRVQVVFVPSGVWHVVVNDYDSIALTQNWVSKYNFPFVWRDLRTKRAHLAARLLQRLRAFYPDIAAVADAVRTCVRNGRGGREEGREARSA